MSEAEQYRIGEGHFLAFHRLATARPFRFCLTLFGGYLLLVLGTIAGLGGSTPLWCLAGLMAFLVSLLCINRVYTLPRQARAAYREDAVIGEPTTLTLNASGWTTEHASGRSIRRWQDMVKWDENDAIFALYSNRQFGHILPKDQIPAHIIDDVRHHLIASGLPKKGKLRK